MTNYNSTSLLHFLSLLCRKWDAGMATVDHTPEGRGFETSFGYFHHDNDYYNEKSLSDLSCNQTITDLWDTNRPAHGINGTDYEEFLFRDRILEIIENHNASEPLFLYYAPHLVHSPLEVHTRNATYVYAHEQGEL